MEAVALDEAGRIGFKSGDSGNRPALLLKDDFPIANVLCFSEAEPLWPTFDLRQSEKTDAAGRPLLFKSFSPAWLGVTDFGRSFYTCQQILEALIFYPESFTIAPKEAFPADNLWQPTQEIISTLLDLKRTFGVAPQSHRVSQSASFFQREILQNQVDDGRPLKLLINVQNFTTSLVVFEVDDSSIFSREAATRRVSAYDAVLEELAVALPTLVPVYLRMNQLLSLLYSLNEILKHGLAAPEETITMAKKNQTILQGELKNIGMINEQYCYRLPF